MMINGPFFSIHLPSFPASCITWQTIAYEYNNLRDIADSLANENARLKTRYFQSRTKHSAYLHRRSSQWIVASSNHTTSSLRSVINNSINQRNNHFTIDKGINDGIRKGMGVISPHGIAGIIDQVGKEYSTAISILHSAHRISASIRRNQFFGSLVWKEIDPSIHDPGSDPTPGRYFDR